MSFVANGLGGIVKALGRVTGLLPEPPKPIQAPDAPTADNQAASMDAAAQAQAASLSRGRTSTLLTGGAGETTDLTKTSKVLLGQ